MPFSYKCQQILFRLWFLSVFVLLVFEVAAFQRKAFWNCNSSPACRRHSFPLQKGTHDVVAHRAHLAEWQRTPGHTWNCTWIASLRRQDLNPCPDWNQCQSFWLASKAKWFFYMAACFACTGAKFSFFTWELVVKYMQFFHITRTKICSENQISEQYNCGLGTFFSGVAVGWFTPRLPVFPRCSLHRPWHTAEGTNRAWHKTFTSGWQANGSLKVWQSHRRVALVHLAIHARKNWHGIFALCILQLTPGFHYWSKISETWSYVRWPKNDQPIQRAELDTPSKNCMYASPSGLCQRKKRILESVISDTSLSVNSQQVLGPPSLQSVWGTV